MNRIARLAASLILLLPLALSCTSTPTEIGEEFAAGWPREYSSLNKPWTRWWWMGNAVDRESLTATLEEFNRKGLGGVEISPVYGVEGYEERELDFLSPAWVDMLDHTIDEASRLGMGVDMIGGTGWPYGGPEVSREDAATRLVIKKYKSSAAHPWGSLKISSGNEKTGADPLLHLLAAGPDGERLDLTGKVDASGNLDWAPDRGEWFLYACFLGKTGQEVKRAAPGGRGLVIDHFSPRAVAAYQAWLDRSLGADNRGLRAVFNDSYEAYETDWTPDFFASFAARKGYDLRRYLKELSGEGDPQIISRIRCDYREVLSELLLENFAEKMTGWANRRNSLFRNQAHGSPGNILDLYGAADIPECETFGASSFDIPMEDPVAGMSLPAEQDQFITRFAASAAHTSGRPLVSSESMTWLREHFTAVTAQMKPEAENLFTSGVNHIFFHGSTFSPSTECWPGWKFYASVNLAPSNVIWEHSEALFEYLTRCQALLQQGRPDSDVLLYFPAYDLWSDSGPDSLAFNLSIHNLDEWLHGMPMFEDMRLMTRRGWLYDLVSDRQLDRAEFDSGSIVLAGSSYRVLVIPEMEYMPLSTMNKIMDLARQGATVILHGRPSRVPGLAGYREGEEQLAQALSSLRKTHSADGITAFRPTGGRVGSVLSGERLDALLEAALVRRESLADSGLQFIRRRHTGGWNYYLVNHTGRLIDEYLDLQVPARNFLILDPQTGKEGLAENAREGQAGKVRVRMEPGEALFVQALGEKPPGFSPWKWTREKRELAQLDGEWTIRALSGGPVLPSQLESEGPCLWTGFGHPAWNDFSGVAEYSTQFNLAESPPAEALLKTDRIFSSGKVRVNGMPAGYLWSRPLRVEVGKFLKKGLNTLSIEVAGTSVNRIRYLDRHGFKWKKFKDINIVDLNYEPLDVSDWETFPSGLGSVTLWSLE